VTELQVSTAGSFWLAAPRVTERGWAWLGTAFTGFITWVIGVYLFTSFF
jgi:hypothetical protein